MLYTSYHWGPPNPSLSAAPFPLKKGTRMKFKVIIYLIVKGFLIKVHDFENFFNNNIYKY